MNGRLEHLLLLSNLTGSGNQFGGSLGQALLFPRVPYIFHAPSTQAITPCERKAHVYAGRCDNLCLASRAFKDNDTNSNVI